MVPLRFELRWSPVMSRVHYLSAIGPYLFYCLYYFNNINAITIVIIIITFILFCY